ncbi:MAG: 50S ribosomal protein L25 [Dehalococcoidia bacterium]|nr:50S ribosomal protein L25 [Dehalococcoidia bacterium]
MAAVTLSAAPRQMLGKKARFLRRAGLLPANIFGLGQESQSVQVQDHDLRELLRHGGRNQLIDLTVEGEKTPVSAMIRGVQRNPVSRQLMHVDFIRVSLTTAINASVPLVFVGESLGVKMFGGVLVHNMDSVQVRALPANMPQHVEVDISVLAELDQTLHVRDLSAGSDVEIVSDPDALVAKVEPPRLAVEGEGEEAPAAVAVVGEEATAE